MFPSTSYIAQSGSAAALAASEDTTATAIRPLKTTTNTHKNTAMNSALFNHAVEPHHSTKTPRNIISSSPISPSPIATTATAAQPVPNNNKSLSPLELELRKIQKQQKELEKKIQAQIRYQQVNLNQRTPPSKGNPTGHRQKTAFDTSMDPSDASTSSMASSSATIAMAPASAVKSLPNKDQLLDDAQVEAQAKQLVSMLTATGSGSIDPIGKQGGRKLFTSTQTGSMGSKPNMAILTPPISSQTLSTTLPILHTNKMATARASLSSVRDKKSPPVSPNVASSSSVRMGGQAGTNQAYPKMQNDRRHSTGITQHIPNANMSITNPISANQVINNAPISSIHNVLLNHSNVAITASPMTSMVGRISFLPPIVATQNSIGAINNSIGGAIHNSIGGAINNSIGSAINNSIGGAIKFQTSTIPVVSGVVPTCAATLVGPSALSPLFLAPPPNLPFSLPSTSATTSVLLAGAGAATAFAGASTTSAGTSRGVGSSRSTISCSKCGALYAHDECVMTGPSKRICVSCLITAS